MPTITFTLSSENVSRVVSAFAQDYQETLDDGTANPQTRVQYARQQLSNIIKSHVISHERKEAQRALQQPANIDITVS